jgi:hypothetical protein
MSAGVEFDAGQLAAVTRFEMRPELFGAATHDISGRTNHIRSKFPMSGP